MTSPTLPWSPGAEQFIRYGAVHAYILDIYERGDQVPAPVYKIPGIQVLSCEVTYDQGWSPYVQGRATIVTPDAATLAKLDPRTLVAVEVHAGYVLPDGTVDTHLMCRAMLSNREADHSNATTTLEFQGLEFVYDDDVNLFDGSGSQEYSDANGWSPSTTVEGAVFDVLETCNVWAVQWTSLGTVSQASGWIPDWENWRSRAGEYRIDLLREVADRNGLWFRCDEYGTWHATPWPVGGGPIAHYLRVGADGTVIQATTGLSRERFANAVFLTYRWTDVHLIAPGAPPAETIARSATAYAAIADGPYAPAMVGRVPLIVTRQMHPAAGIAEVAAQILARTWSYGDAITLDAIAAYWLRAGDVVSIQLEGETLGTQYLLRAVTFDLEAGRMSCTVYETDPSGHPPFTIETQLTS